MIWLLAFLPLLFGGGGSSSSAPLADAPDSRGLQQLRDLGRRAQLPEEWVAFFAWTAYGESRWNNLAGLGDPDLAPPWARMNVSAAEAAAARRAYERNAAKLQPCGFPQHHYEFGSGGWFGMLPANGLARLPKSLRCLGPYSVFEPEASLVQAVRFAKGLTGWKQFQRWPSWINLRVMWGNPSRGGDPTLIAAKRAKLTEHARAAGLPPGWIDLPVSPLPSINYELMFQRLKGAS